MISESHIHFVYWIKCILIYILYTRYRYRCSRSKFSMKYLRWCGCDLLAILWACTVMSPNLTKLQLRSRCSWQWKPWAKYKL